MFDLTIDGGIDLDDGSEPLDGDEGSVERAYMVDLGDFDASEDTLVVTPLSSDESISFSDASLETVPGLPGGPDQTNLVLRFNDEDGSARVIIVELGDAAVSLSDIAIVEAGAA